MPDLLLIWLFPVFLIVGPVLALNGVVQLCIRKKTGPWKEAGASLLAGAIMAGVSVFLAWLYVMGGVGGWLSWFFIVAALALLFNGVVQLCVRKKTGLWKEGGASLLAGAIIAGVPVFLLWLSRMGVVGIWLSPLPSKFFIAAGLVLLFNGVVQLCVRKKTGLWKEGGASLLAGAIIAGVSALTGFSLQLPLF